MDKLKRNYILNTIFQVLRLLTPLVVTPYISRVLGADGVGIFSYTYSVQYYFSLLAVLGTTGYGAREIARKQNDIEATSRLFWEIKLLSVIISVVSMIAWGVLIGLSEQYRFYYIILSFYLLAAMVDISWFFTGLEKFPLIVVRNIAMRLIEVALIFLLVKDAGDLWLYCLVMAGGTFLGNLSLWGGLRKNLVRVKWSELKILRHMKGTLIFFLPTIATSMYTVLDKTLIGVITQDTAENGYYEQATKIIEVAKAVAFVSLNAVLSPRCSNLFANEKYGEVKKMLRGSMDFMLMLGIGIACGIAGVADVFVPWFFGEGFEEVALLLKCLSPIIIIISISNALGYQYYDPAGLRLKSAKYLVAGAVCNLIMNCILIPHLQSVGAVLGSLIAELLISVLYLKNCDGYLRVKDLVSMGWKKTLAGMLMLVYLTFRSSIYQPVLVDLVLLVLQGVLIYFVLLLILHDSMLITVLKKVLKKQKAT